MSLLHRACLCVLPLALAAQEPDIWPKADPDFHVTAEQALATRRIWEAKAREAADGKREKVDPFVGQTFYLESAETSSLTARMGRLKPCAEQNREVLAQYHLQPLKLTGLSALHVETRMRDEETMYCLHFQAPDGRELRLNYSLDVPDLAEEDWHITGLSRKNPVKASWSLKVKAAIRKGEVLAGMDKDHVRLALGPCEQVTRVRALDLTRWDYPGRYSLFFRGDRLARIESFIMD